MLPIIALLTELVAGLFIDVNDGKGGWDEVEPQGKGGW